MSGKVILDIETVGVDWNALEKDTQDYLLKYADTVEKAEDATRRLGLWAPLSKVVIIRLLNPANEAAILAKFWELIPHYTKFITFNGKGFDCPFLMLRSLIQGITPSRNLDTRRFSISPHCDLLEVLTFFGATRKFTLQFWCQTLGIADPKAQFGDGSQVQETYKAGRMDELIDYNLADLVATAELYRQVEERLLSVWNKK